jgi:hypothetical protein
VLVERWKIQRPSATFSTPSLRPRQRAWLVKPPASPFFFGATCIMPQTGVKMLLGLTFEEHSEATLRDVSGVGKGRLSLANFIGPPIIKQPGFPYSP